MGLISTNTTIGLGVFKLMAVFYGHSVPVHGRLTAHICESQLVLSFDIAYPSLSLSH